MISYWIKKRYAVQEKIANHFYNAYKNHLKCQHFENSAVKPREDCLRCKTLYELYLKNEEFLSKL